MIRVFVRAGSALEMAGLEALVNSSAALELAGSSLSTFEASGASASADVLLERPTSLESPDTDVAPADEGLARVWILAEGEFEQGLAAVREGTVQALLPATATADEIVSAIQAASSGLIVLHPDFAGAVSPPEAGLGTSGSSLSSGRGQALSPRESEVLNLLAAGFGNKQLAAHLKISEHTVKFHITSIFNKLGASNRAEAVAMGVRRGLIIL